MTRHQVLQQILRHPTISAKLTGRRTAQGEEIVWCIFHPDGAGKAPHEPNLRISEKGYYCFACKAKGSLQDLARHLRIELDREPGQPVQTWDYWNAEGSEKLFQVCRYETPKGKTYGVRRQAPGGWEHCEHRERCRRDKVWCAKGWIGTLHERPCSPAVAPVLYNLPLLRAASPEGPVAAPEGEPCVDVFVTLGYIATTNPFGAGSWRPEYSEELTDRDIALYADADEPGRAHVQHVAQSLWRKVKSIKVIDLYPDRNDGSDVADWVAERRARGFDDDSIRAEIEALVGQTPEWRPRLGDNLQTSPPTIVGTVGGEVGGQERLRGISLAALRQKAREAGVEGEALPLLGRLEPPVFQRGLSHILASPPKAGKTTLLYAQAKEWAGAGAPVLFISEEPELVWYRRLEAEIVEDEVLARITLVPALGESPELLLQRMSQGPEDIVILDTAKILGVEDENDAATVNRMVTPWVVQSRETGKTLIVAHHLRKGGGRAVEALAGSYSWAAVFDTVVEIALDEQDCRRQLRAVGRLLPSCKLLYELRDEELLLLGSPEAVEFEATKERVLGELTVEWMTTGQVHAGLGDPTPSLEQVRRALNSLASEEKVERDPAWCEGQRRGATYRWRVPEPSGTSPPTPFPMVGSEVGGSDQGTLPMPPTAGGQ